MMKRLVDFFFRRSRRLPEPATRRPGFRPALETLEERQLMNVGYGGGPIIPNVQVEAVFYGASWTDTCDSSYPRQPTTRYDIQKYLVDLTGSPYLNGLAQYTMTNAAGQTVAPGRGTFLGSDTIKDANLPFVFESWITTALDNDANLPTPDGNKLYMVFLPENVTLLDNNGNRQDGFHSFHTDQAGHTRYYAIMASPYGNDAWQSGFHLTPFQALTAITSHELAEAVSDPMVGSNDPSKLGWQGSVTINGKTYSGEIGDIAANLLGANQFSRLDGYVVQQYWSNIDFAGIAPGGVAFQALQQVPVFSTRQFVLFNNSNCLLTSYPLTINSQANNYAQGNSFQGTWGPNGEAVYGTLSVDTQTDQVNIQVYRSSDGQMIFSGTITAPDGNWQSNGNVEVSGQVLQNGSWVSAFGWENHAYLPGGYSVGDGGAGGYVSLGYSSAWGYVPGQLTPSRRVHAAE
jgi:hypothetical protein